MGKQSTPNIDICWKCREGAHAMDISKTKIAKFRGCVCGCHWSDRIEVWLVQGDGFSPVVFNNLDQALDEVRAFAENEHDVEIKTQWMLRQDYEALPEHQGH